MNIFQRVAKALTQDSAVWTYGFIGSVLAQVVAFSDILGDKPSRILALVSACLLAISAFFKSSPLPRRPWTDEERANNHI